MERVRIDRRGAALAAAGGREGLFRGPPSGVQYGPVRRHKPRCEDDHPRVRLAGDRLLLS